MSADRIRGLIMRGELGALNTAPTRSGKPRFVILPHHLAEFAECRAAKAPEPARRRRRQPPLVDFFPDAT
jgi:hypothetical protein